MLSLMKNTRLKKSEKLKCSLVWFLNVMLLARDVLKAVEPNLIKMANDLEFFESYLWGKESFSLTLEYLKDKIDMSKLKGAHLEKETTLYALFGFPWAFMMWIYEAFPNAEKHAAKSEEVPLPIPRMLRWHSKKTSGFPEGDPFRAQAGSSKIVHPYLTPTVHEMKETYMKILVSNVDEVRDRFIDGLKRELKYITALESPPMSLGQEHNYDGDVDIGGKGAKRIIVDQAGSTKKGNKAKQSTNFKVTDEKVLNRLFLMESDLKIMVEYVRKQEEKEKQLVDISLKNHDAAKTAARTFVHAFAEAAVHDQVTGIDVEEEQTRTLADKLLIDNTAQKEDDIDVVLDEDDGAVPAESKTDEVLDEEMTQYKDDELPDQQAKDDEVPNQHPKVDDLPSQDAKVDDLPVQESKVDDLSSTVDTNVDEVPALDDAKDNEVLEVSKDDATEKVDDYDGLMVIVGEINKDILDN